MARHPITGSDEGDNLVQALASDAKGFGGLSGDVLSGWYGSDTLYGQGGSDVLIGGAGEDWHYGGADDDQRHASETNPGGGGNYLHGGAGNDHLVFGFMDKGQAYGGRGNDTLDLTTYDAFGTFVPTIVTLVDGAGSALTAGQLIVFTGIEHLRVQTSQSDDVVTAAGGDNWIAVRHGDSLVSAGAGNDHVIYHSGGQNTLDGGAGCDVLEVSHTERWPGLVFTAAGGVVTDGNGSLVTGFESFIVDGWRMNGHVVLGDGGDQFPGWTGDDTGEGGLGRDRPRGHGGDDLLFGGGGGDWIHGGSGDDVMEGGQGHDRLNGALGFDTLTGGDGADYFRFRDLGETHDHVTDLVAGEDRLVYVRSLPGLSIDAQPGDPNFLAINGPDAAHGQFVFFDGSQSNPGDLRRSPDGTGANGGDIVVVLDGVTSLSADDFFLI